MGFTVPAWLKRENRLLANRLYRESRYRLKIVLEPAAYPRPIQYGTNVHVVPPKAVRSQLGGTVKDWAQTAGERDMADLVKMHAPPPTQKTAAEVEAIARVCHEANTAYCVTTGDPALPHWDALEETYRESSRHGVRMALDGKSPEMLHRSWCRDRLAQGWKYGEVLDREAKIHPCLVPYPQLPAAQQKKDALFHAIVQALR